jgi:hypothetical protein
MGVVQGELAPKAREAAPPVVRIEHGRGAAARRSGIDQIFREAEIRGLAWRFKIA